MSNSDKPITQIQKVAMLLVSLGQDSAKVLAQFFNQEELKQIATGISQIDEMHSDQMVDVVQEFYKHLSLEEEMSSDNGLKGNFKSKSARPQDVLNILENFEVRQLAEYLQDEPLQSIAIMLAYLEPVRCAAIISELPWEKQRDVILSFDRVEISDPSSKLKLMGLAPFLSEILNYFNSDASHAALEALKISNPDLARDVSLLLSSEESLKSGAILSGVGDDGTAI